MKRFALIGKNIQDSLSPVIHSAYGCQYDLLDVEEDQLEWALSQPYDGFNVTSPYKEKVCKFLAGKFSITSCVNTIKKNPYNGKLFGYDTDTNAFLKVIEKLHLELSGRICIIGLGAMAKMVKSALLSRNIELQFDMIDSRITNILTDNNSTAYINCSPRQDFKLAFSGQWVMDLGYKDDTFIKNARARGNFAFNGMGMLIAQAEKSQRIWNE